MAAALRRRLIPGAAIALVAGLFALPLLAALPLALAEAASAAAWQALAEDAQVPKALRLSLFTSVVSTAIALALTLLVVTQLHGTRAWLRVSALLAPMLSLPHAAFAIGLAWLIAPAGWLARLLAPLAGWSAPPGWETVNDERGLALVLVLVLKELPFLLWSAAALLARPEVAATVAREIAVARTLGYPPRAWWWRVGWLQWLPRLAWPLLAVLAYSLTVVDLALIVGPSSPPTLAVLAWQGLTDAARENNRQGAAAAVLLGAVLLALVAVFSALGWALRAAWRGRVRSGRRPRRIVTRPGAGALMAVVAGLYLAAGAALVVMSLAGPWPFPELLPPEASARAWVQVSESAGSIGLTAALGLAAAAAALLLVLAWLEATPPQWDGRVAPLVLAPLVLPGLLLMVGLYQGALWLRLDGTLAGLLWVHMLLVLPYVFTALAPAWRSFDRRYEWTALALGRQRLVFWWRVKWPLLAAPLASALAIGFAVSVAQYLATQFIGAGRHATVTTEAVTLASGGQRNVAAAFALLQALLPGLGFLAAWAVGRAALRRLQPAPVSRR